MSHKAPYTVLLSVLAVLLLSLCACESGGGGDETDGDADSVEIEAEGAVCTEGVSSCSGTEAIICYEGRWQVLDDCANYEKVCEKGICVYPSEDGDGEIAEFESEESDGDDGEHDSTDDINPYVESSAPLQNQEDVETTLKIILINFSEVMDAAKISPIQRALSVSGHCDTTLSFTAEIRAGGKQLKVTMNENLHPGTTHHVTLNPEKWFDPAGNPLGEYTLSFTTAGEAPDTPCADGDGDGENSVNPYIENSVPAHREMGVALDLDDVKIKFSKKMETYNYDLAAGVSITGNDNHIVSFAGSWFLNDQWLRLDLSENLHADTIYTVSLAAGLESDEGGYPLGEVSFWFSTYEAQSDGDSDIDTDPDPDTSTDNDVDGTPPSNVLEIVKVDYVMAYDAPYNPQQHPRSVEASWNPQTGKITVVHHNVPYDRNLTGLSADMTQTGWHIELFEMSSVLVPDGTNYPFDVTIKIDGAANFPGEWDIAIYYDGASDPDETNLAVP